MNIRDWILGILLSICAYFAQNAYQDIRRELAEIRAEGSDRGDSIMGAKQIANNNSQAAESIVKKLDAEMVEAVYVNDEFFVLRMPPRLNDELVKVPMIK